MPDPKPDMLASPRAAEAGPEKLWATVLLHQVLHCQQHCHWHLVISVFLATVTLRLEHTQVPPLVR